MLYEVITLRKNAVQYLQSVAFKDQYIEGQFNNTYAENLLLDVFTGAHPYAPFAIANLAVAVDIYHTNPVLYYVPNVITSYSIHYTKLYEIKWGQRTARPDRKPA